MKKLIILTTILFIVRFITPIFAQTEQKPTLVVQTGHTGQVWSIAFSPDGKQIASGGGDTSIKLWNTASGVEIRTLEGHTSYVNSIAFSPDGKQIISGSSDWTIKLWDVSSGKLINTLSENDSMVWSVAFSPDGKQIASGNGDSTIKIWDVVRGKLLRTLKGHTSNVNSVAFSPDGKMLASGSTDKTIKLWDAASGQLLRTLEGHASYVNSVVFAPKRKIIASASEDKTVKLWDAASGKLINTLSENAGKVWSVAFSPDGKQIAFGDGENSIKIWDVVRGKLLRTLKGHSFPSSVAFSLSGKMLAMGNYGNTVELWDTASGQLLRTLEGHASNVNQTTFSPNGKMFASIDIDETIRLWDAASGNVLRTLNSGHTETIWAVEFSRDNKRLVSGSSDKTIKLWDVASGQLIKTIEGANSPVWLVAFSPDGKQIVSASEDKTIKLWDAASGKLLHHLEGHTSAVWSLAFSSDGKILATGSYDSTIKLWDTASGRELRTLRGHENWVGLVAFSLDGKRLASVSTDNTIKLWDVSSGEILNSYPRNDPKIISKVSAAFPTFYYLQNNHVDSFSPDGRFQINRGEHGKLKLLEVKSGKLLATLIALDNNDWIVATSDGRFDTNKLENPQGLHWIMPDAPFTPLSFEVFMRDYFEPKLLPRLLKCTEGGNCDKDKDSLPREFRPVRNLTQLNRTQPTVKITGIKPTDAADVVKVTVETEDAVSEYQKDKQHKPLRSGVYDLRVFRDGQMVAYSTSDEKLDATFRTYNNFDEELKVWRDANKVDLVKGKKVFTFNVKLSNNPVGERVEFSAYAFNDDRVKSETARATYTIHANANFKPQPRKAYVITFGVNKYENPEWNLQFAGNDARAMNEIFSRKLRERNEFAEVVEIPLISDDETANGEAIEKRDATKNNIKAVLDLLSRKTPSAENLKRLEKAIGTARLAKIKQANPGDMVLISFSSHGYADQNGIFYILPTDIGKDSGKKVTNELLRRSISSDELSLWLRDVDASEMVMIVDACHAASAVEGKDFKPAPMGSRGLGQLAFDKGMRILTATQAANVAIESGGSIRHGLLTYALLSEGFEKNKADFKPKDKTINLKEWLEYGEIEVPKLYERLAKGELKGIGRGIEKIDLSDKAQNSLQTPTLFDFTRRKEEIILATFP